MAGYSINRIPESDSIFTGATVSPLWTSAATLKTTSIFERHVNEGSLQANILENEKIYYNYNPVTSAARSSLISTTERDRGDHIDAFLWVKAEAAMDVSLMVRLSYVNQAGIETEIDSEVSTISIPSGEWYLLRSNGVLVPDDGYFYAISLFITPSSYETPLTTENVYISHPVIYGRLDLMDNPAVFDIFNRLPLYIKESDMDMSNPTYPLFRFVEIACLHHGEIVKMLDDFTYADISEGYDPSRADTKSQLVNKDVVLRRFMPWLAQFTGTRLVNPTVSSTPWSKLPEDWQGIDEIDTPILDANDSVTWTALMDLDPEITGLEDYLRWQISNMYFGMRSGSTQAVTSVLKRVLTGTKYVSISQSAPFITQINTKLSETPYSDTLAVGDTVPEILELLSHTKPAGYIFTHTLVS